jgi:hypothetical protein
VLLVAPAPAATVDPAPSSPVALVAAARRLQAAPSLIRARLGRMRSDPAQLARLAGNAYRHSNGFIKVKLFEGRGMTLRLHVWPPGVGRGDTDPHGHRWEFASWVAAGAGIRETYFTETDVLCGRPYLLHRYGRIDGREFLQHLGRRGLRKDGTYERRVGIVYGCATDVVHTVEPIDDGFVATAVLQARASRPSAPVYRAVGQHSDIRHFPVEPDELGELFALVEAAIRS